MYPQIKRVPLDLKLVLIWLLITPVCIFAPYLSESILRALVAIPVVLFIPGYLLVASLFPEKTDITSIERMALSIGLSIAIVPLIGLTLNYMVFGIRLGPVVMLLEIFSLIFWVIAYQRRIDTGLDDDITLPDIRHLLNILNGLPRIEKILSYCLIGCVLIALGTTLFVTAVPRVNDQFTEFYLLNPEGKPISEPIDVVIENSSSVMVGIRNQEFRTADYTVEVYIMKGDQSMMIVRSFPVHLDHGEAWTGQVDFTVPDVSYDKIDLLLFIDGVPSSDITGSNRIASSYRNLYQWLHVVEPTNGNL